MVTLTLWEGHFVWHSDMPGVQGLYSLIQHMSRITTFSSRTCWFEDADSLSEQAGPSLSTCAPSPPSSTLWKVRVWRKSFRRKKFQEKRWLLAGQVSARRLKVSWEAPLFKVFRREQITLDIPVS